MSAKTFFVFGGITLLLFCLVSHFVSDADQPAVLLGVGLANVIGWLQGRYQSRIDGT